MGRRRLIRLTCLVLLTLVASAFARAPGQETLVIKQGAQQLGETATLDMAPATFTCARQSDGRILCQTAAAIPTFGSCVGPPSSFCASGSGGGVQMGSTAAQLPAGTTQPTGSGYCTGAGTNGWIYQQTNAAGYNQLFQCQNGTMVQLGTVLDVGRAGGQTISGGTGAGDSLTLNSSTSTTPTAPIVLAANLTGSLPGSLNVVGFTPAFTSAATGTATINYLNLAPTLTDADAGTHVVTVNAINLGGTFTATASNVFHLTTDVLNGVTYTSATASQVPPSHIGFWNKAIIQDNNVAIAATVNYGRTFQDSATITSTGASAAFTWNELTSFYSVPTVTAATAGGATTLSLRRGLEIADVSKTGAGTVTITDNYGAVIEALAAGASGHNWPLAFGGAAVPSATPASGYGVIGVDAASPKHFYYKNDAGQVWLLGYAMMLGSATANLCSTTTCTDYFPANDSGSPNATEASVSPRIVAPGAIHFFGISCGLSATTGASITRKFSVEIAGIASTHVTCTTAANGQSCSTFSATTEPATTGQTLTIQDVAAGGAPTAATASCVLYYTVDAF